MKLVRRERSQAETNCSGEKRKQSEKKHHESSIAKALQDEKKAQAVTENTF